MIVSEDVYLEHFGVKGQKWGVRRAQRQKNRALNKASKQKDAEKHRKEVDAARARFASGKAKRDYKAAKAQFKKDRVTMGSREARKVLQKAKDKNIRDYETSQQIRDGREAAYAGLAVAGLVGINLFSAYIRSQ